MTTENLTADLERDEEWRGVVGWEGFYEVSSLGRMRGVARLVQRGSHQMRIAPRLLGLFENKTKARPDAPRCVVANLTRENKNHQTKVHRAVPEAFVGPAPSGTEGCHNDGDIWNNVPANLRWDTHAANMADIFAQGKTTAPRNPATGEAHGRAKLTAEQVRLVRAQMRASRFWHR